MVQWYEQFLHIGGLDHALILLGLAHYGLQSLWFYVYLIFLLHSLAFSELSLVRFALDLVN